MGSGVAGEDSHLDRNAFGAGRCVRSRLQASVLGGGARHWEADARLPGARKDKRVRTRLPEWFGFTGDTPPHGQVSTKVLADLLKEAGERWPAVSRRVAQNVAVAVGGHHGIFPTKWDGIRGPLGNEGWAEVRGQVLAELARLFGVREPAPCPAPSDDQSFWMYVAGLTSVADWIGSNQDFFKPVGRRGRIRVAAGTVRRWRCRED